MMYYRRVGHINSAVGAFFPGIHGRRIRISKPIIVKEDNSSGQKDNKLILLGEDDIDDQEFLGEIFSSLNNSYHLESIGNGKKIITFLQSLEDGSLPSLIILDYNLPELNGAE